MKKVGETFGLKTDLGVYMKWEAERKRLYPPGAIEKSRNEFRALTGLEATGKEQTQAEQGYYSNGEDEAQGRRHYWKQVTVLEAGSPLGRRGAPRERGSWQ